MTKILVFLLVVKENIPSVLISAITYANEAKLLTSFFEVVVAINEHFTQISVDENAILSSFSSKGTGLASKNKKKKFNKNYKKTQLIWLS